MSQQLTIGAALGFMCIGAFLTTTLIPSQLFWLSDKSLNLLEDSNGIIPQFPRKKVLFWNETRYEPPVHYTPEAHQDFRAAYENLMPRGRGFIDVPDWQRYELQPPVAADQDSYKTFGIAVFHQMHCVWLIAQSVGEHYTQRKPSQPRSHVFHCIDYLRQAIMCAGDTSLEGLDPFHPEVGTSGTNSTHVCKEYAKIFEWAEKLRLDDDGTLVPDEQPHKDTVS